MSLIFCSVGLNTGRFLLKAAPEEDVSVESRIRNRGRNQRRNRGRTDELQRNVREFVVFVTMINTELSRSSRLIYATTHSHLIRKHTAHPWATLFPTLGQRPLYWASSFSCFVAGPSEGQLPLIPQCFPPSPAQYA
jgi:hypothetical protein